MDLSLEVYRTIVKNIRTRADIAVLSRVSRAFQQVAERALYNTLLIRISTPNTFAQAIALCETLEKQPRVSSLVDALTILVVNEEGTSGDDNADDTSEGEERGEGEEESDEQEDLAAALAMSLEEGVERQGSSATQNDPDDGQRNGDNGERPGPDLDHCWIHISLALQKTTRLRHFNIHIISNVEASMGWILSGTTFRLRSFHCDLIWDHHLVDFLNTQDELEDLYIIDYHDSTGPIRASRLATRSATPTGITPNPVAPLTAQDYPADPTPSFSISPGALQSLHILECTFTEAALVLVPGRPVTRLKTAFSSPTVTAKRTEMNALFDAIRRSTRRIKSLDIGDSVYVEEFGMEMLQNIVATTRTKDDLRYLGTLVLPVGGNERLMFYALLRRIHRLQSVELDVSSWDPPPIEAGPSAFRALANELRIYCRSVKRVIFVHEYDRTVVKVVGGTLRVELGREVTPTETLWRDA